MEVEQDDTIEETNSLTQPTQVDFNTDREAPDGGWGWMVLVGCFFVNFISDGCAYSFGVLFTELVDYFEESKSKTAWIGSLFFSVPLLCGPIASVITARVGCRNATILGGVIAFSGFLCSSFVQSLEGLYITYGIVAGFGMSLPYLTSILVISHYFKKRLAFATGVAECGAGIGTIVFAPASEALLTTFGWRGTMYILAAIAGNIVVCGALFRPLPHKTRTLKVIDAEISLDIFTDNDRNSCSSSKSKLECSVLENAVRNIESVDADSQRMSPARNHDTKHADMSLETDSLYCEVGNNKTNCEIQQSKDNKDVCGNCYHKHCNGFVDNMKLSIFKHPIFLLFVVSSFILYFWFDTPFVFLANRAVKLEMSEARAALLVSVIGVLHTLGNLLFGIAGDIRRLSLPLLYGVSIAVCGASLLLVPSFSTFLPLAILAGMFGLFSAASEALSSILLIDILGEEYLSESYGFTMLLKGIANLIGPPVAGWLFDASGNYDNTFYAAGSCMVVAGLMYVPTPWLRRFSCCTVGGHKDRLGTGEMISR